MANKYAVVEAQNLAMGQSGSIFVTGTTAVTCGAGTGIFVAIQFIEDTVFASGAGGLMQKQNNYSQMILVLVH